MEGKKSFPPQTPPGGVDFTGVRRVVLGIRRPRKGTETIPSSVLNFFCFIIRNKETPEGDGNYI